MSAPEPKLLKVVSISFNEEEARVTLQLFDAALKSIGLNAAEAVAILAKKINSAFQEPDPKSNVVQSLPSIGN